MLRNLCCKIFGITAVSILLLTSQGSLAQGQNPERSGIGKQRRQPVTGVENRRAEKTNVPPLEPSNAVLGSPTSHSVVANIFLEKENEAYLEYSAKRDQYGQKTKTVKATVDEQVELVIGNLQPNTRYFYRISYRKSNAEDFKPLPGSSFYTQRKKNATFSFGVQGDSHPEREGKMFNPSLYKQTLDSVAQRRPDFFFMMGDDFSADRLIRGDQVNKDNVEKIYRIQRYYLGAKGNFPPIFLVNGNHEQAARYLLKDDENDLAVLVANALKKYFPQPNPDGFYTGDKEVVKNIGFLNDYYSFEWGDALFVVIDFYWHSPIAVDNQPGSPDGKDRRDPWAITLGNEQYQWFKQILEGSKAKFKFVFTHHVLGTGRGGVERAKYFEWGGYGQDGTWQFYRFRVGWEMPIHQLMVKNKVTIFFQGHDHLFNKQELDGIIYQSVPIPADDTYTAFNRDAYASGKILPNSGFLDITVNGKEVKVEYVRSWLKAGPTIPEEAKSNYSYTIK